MRLLAMVESRPDNASKSAHTTNTTIAMTTLNGSTRAESHEEKEIEEGPSSGLLSQEPKQQRNARAFTFRGLLGYDAPETKLRPTAWLDGLRGLAAFEVFIFHYCDGWTNHGLAWGERGAIDRSWWRLPFIRSLYASGDTAVCVFFAISGYVLTHKMLHLLKRWRHEELYASLASAMFRRGIRLYLPVIIESFILMVLARIGLPKAAVYEDAPTVFLELKRWVWNIIHLFMPLRYPDRWTEIMNFYDGTISWTIPLEYYGSMVVYGTILLLSRTKSTKVRLSLLAAFILVAFLKDDWIAAQFLLGMSFAEYSVDRADDPNKPTTHPRLRRILPWIILTFGLYLSGLPLYHVETTYSLKPRPFYDWIGQPLAWIGGYNDRKGDRYLDCLAGIAIVIGVGSIPRVTRIMETRFVQYLGKISFGLYLCHIFLHAYLRKLDPFYVALVGLSQEQMDNHDLADPIRLFLAYCMMMVPSVIVNFAVGSLFEKYLDRPSVRAAKWFEQWCLSIE